VVAAAELHECDFPEGTLAEIGRKWRCRGCGSRWELQGGTIFAWHSGESYPEEREWFQWQLIS
jgi:hypothetical protein